MTLLKWCSFKVQKRRGSVKQWVVLRGREEKSVKGAEVDGKQTVRRKKGNGHEESITQSCYKVSCYFAQNTAVLDSPGWNPNCVGPDCRTNSSLKLLCFIFYYTKGKCPCLVRRKENISAQRDPSVIPSLANNSVRLKEIFSFLICCVWECNKGTLCSRLCCCYRAQECR